MKGNFQTIIIGLFIFFIIAGVLLFAGLNAFRGGDEDVGPARAVVWGTLDRELFGEVINRVNLETDNSLDVTYREFRADEFDTELVEALASGVGPDIILLPQDSIVRHGDKVATIPFESVSERQFKDLFVEEGELYLVPSGILALPFSIDPLVMYWNRTVFANAGIARPPLFWDEFFSLAQRITEKDESLNITKSTVAFGTFRNVKNAKNILTALIMQAGNPITQRSSADTDSVDILLNQRLGALVSPAESALNFYTEFSNPVKSVYSWNNALPLSTQVFLAGDLGIYIGFASELFELREKNPNLNFDVAPLPQVRDGDVKRTFANISGLAVLKGSSDTASAFRAAGILSSSLADSAWTDASGLPPVRRDLLAEKQTDAFRSVFYDAALISDAFLDPDGAQTDVIFQRMVEDITSGRERVGSAVTKAQRAMEALLE